MGRSALEAGIAELAEMDLPADWNLVSAAEFPFGFGDDQIDAVVDAPESRDAKVAALRAHATQVSVEPAGRACALSNLVALPIVATEHYVLAAGAAGERDDRGWETDLLAGLNLG
jgi:N-acetyl-1-D-myo-inositol-2-amino-2-deoxy-alpha-D-glucopyranoside deacetylase